MARQKSVEENTTEEQTVVETGPAPNVVYIGRRDDRAISKFHNGMRPAVHLPPVEEQYSVEEQIENAGEENEKTVKVVMGLPFYLKEAGQLTELYPHLYKRFVEKGF